MAKEETELVRSKTEYVVMYIGRVRSDGGKSEVDGMEFIVSRYIDRQSVEEIWRGRMRLFEAPYLHGGVNAISKSCGVLRVRIYLFASGEASGFGSGALMLAALALAARELALSQASAL
jgi:hypothetical protein